VYDKGKIIGGLAIFLCIASFPVWYMAASGKADYRPNPILPVSENQCVESAQYMREYHMQLMQQWRDQAVRQGDSTYISSDNRTFDINLTGTCLKCHPSRADFCDRCHNYTGTVPNCWDCHNVPPAPTRPQVTQ
jgi:hypothetical protein